ncbi:unnamed protein product, partial [Bubo scandiacus]
PGKQTEHPAVFMEGGSTLQEILRLQKEYWLLESILQKWVFFGKATNHPFSDTKYSRYDVLERVVELNPHTIDILWENFSCP